MDFFETNTNEHEIESELHDEHILTFCRGVSRVSESKHDGVSMTIKNVTRLLLYQLSSENVADLTLTCFTSVFDYFRLEHS